MSKRKGWFSRRCHNLARLGSSTESRSLSHYQASQGIEALETRALLSVAPAGFAETTYTSGLQSPTDMAFAPDGRLFVTEKMGDVRVIDANGNLLETPFLTVATDAQGHHGLLSIAFDPNFETNGYVYVYYTVAEGDPATRLSRFTVSNTDLNVADPNSEVVILGDIDTPIDLHDGGGMKFGDDGLLYLGIGDGGIPDAAQDMTSLLGKMLRLDVSNYPNIIPADNPYVGVEGVRPEIYASGVRNPFKLSIDSETGRTWFTNTGTNPIEEINELTAEANYGFPIYEGPSGDPNYDDPVYSYEHGELGGAISGANFYRGNLFPEEYNGDFFFADFSRQAISRIDLTGEPGDVGEVTSEFFVTQVAGPVDIETGPDGALYYLDIWLGLVSRIDYVGGENRLPEAVASVDVNHGAGPLTVTLDGTASSDPDGNDLFYSWDFGDGYPLQPGATVQHTYSNPGIYYATLTVHDGEGGSDVSTAVMIAVGESAPVGNITIAPEHQVYHGGETINFSATASDFEDGVLGASAFSWKVEFINNGEVFPFMGPLEGVTSGSFVVPTTGENSTNVSYRISLTVTDSVGLKQTSSVEVVPQVTQISLTTDPGTLDVMLNGVAHANQVTFDAVVGVQYSLETPEILQSEAGVTYLFQSWSDGGPVEHTVVAAANPTTYTAMYQSISSDRVAASYFVAGLYEHLLGRVADIAGLQSNVDRLMAGDSPESVIESLWESAEHRRMQVFMYFGEILERIPATDEINHWVEQLGQGVSETEMAATLLTSTEFISLTRNIPSFYVADLYRLILKRQPTGQEAEGWVNALNNGVAHIDIANLFLTSAERYNLVLGGYYNDYLDRAMLPSEALGDVYAGSATSLLQVGTSVLASSEFLTRQTARPTVVALYDNVLHRTASDGEVNYWTNQLLNGVSRGTVANAFHQSVEGLGHFVTEAYGAILERLPSDPERDYWVAQIGSGATEQSVIQTFFLSAEYQALYSSNDAFISSLYIKLLNREADSAGLQAWVAALQSGVSRATAVATFLATAEYRGQVISDIYNEFLGRSPVAAETAYWNANLPTDGTIAAKLRTAVLSSDEYYRTATVHTVVAHNELNETYVAALYDDILQRPATPQEIAEYSSILSAGVSRFNVTSQLWNSPERASLVANDLYTNLLGRAPTAQEAAAVAAALLSTGGSMDSAFGILSSNEYNTLHASDEAFVIALYSDVLNRAAGRAEIDFWTLVISHGNTRATVASVIQHSDEALGNLIDAAYNDYLEHDAEAGVAQVWLDQLSSGAQTERDLALSLLTSEEYYQLQSP